MKVTKKDQIIQLYKEGIGIEGIIQKGFTKKYVNQVLKDLKSSDFVTPSNNKFNINDIKQLTSVLEMLQNKSDRINMHINISIKIDSCSDASNDTKIPLLNPVTAFRDVGEDRLKEELMLLQLEDLIKITKAYTPDLNGKIYKQKNVNVIIDYIIERASKLSKVGQVFRTVSKSE
ncbi:hypothetical protein [Clostridium aciditolerans]|uniref:Uncharacterized protein n=1 Tax=Clostridium aciditolerans TaxID=339861 RepID=A0A934I4L7_9CLOT|nr:hypothetical protein [Clostridium aciditolerans]MBI6874886.1 hypothetical protein [Clostridium aciditolerans]